MSQIIWSAAILQATRDRQWRKMCGKSRAMTYYRNSIIPFNQTEWVVRKVSTLQANSSAICRVVALTAEMRFNKVRMHCRVSICYCLKWAALITCQSHSKPSRLKDAFMSTKVLFMWRCMYCCIKVILSFDPNFISSDQKTVFRSFPSWACRIKV